MPRRQSQHTPGIPNRGPASNLEPSPVDEGGQASQAATSAIPTARAQRYQRRNLRRDGSREHRLPCTPSLHDSLNTHTRTRTASSESTVNDTAAVVTSDAILCPTGNPDQPGNILPFIQGVGEPTFQAPGTSDGQEGCEDMALADRSFPARRPDSLLQPRPPPNITIIGHTTPQMQSPASSAGDNGAQIALSAEDSHVSGLHQLLSNGGRSHPTDDRFVLCTASHIVGSASAMEVDDVQRGDTDGVHNIRLGHSTLDNHAFGVTPGGLPAHDRQPFPNTVNPYPHDLASDGRHSTVPAGRVLDRRSFRESLRAYIAPRRPAFRPVPTDLPLIHHRAVQNQRTPRSTRPRAAKASQPGWYSSPYLHLSSEPVPPVAEEDEEDVVQTSKKSRPMALPFVEPLIVEYICGRFPGRVARARHLTETPPPYGVAYRDVLRLRCIGGALADLGIGTGQGRQPYIDVEVCGEQVRIRPDDVMVTFGMRPATYRTKRYGNTKAPGRASVRSNIGRTTQ
ncbi:hypothetical protein OH76DRAFT_1486889 [Lentinus brumalis]|uniref:Uncharacterized protein n=1 Tax=Lentinus brumalis TaxID=2498619 RepID=A0A371CWT8_9APHY|nr:hypothetical protein OH76DRAFT_1486889 [Polyporus brumalis]